MQKETINKLSMCKNKSYAAQGALQLCSHNLMLKTTSLIYRIKKGLDTCYVVPGKHLFPQNLWTIEFQENCWRRELFPLPISTKNTYYVHK